jgi:hypothetical protein
MTATREQDPTPEEAISLFEALEKRFPSATLGHDKWYLVAVSMAESSCFNSRADISPKLAALSGSPHSEVITNLYTYLISKPEYSTSDSRKALIRRIREGLVKCVSIVGVSKPMDTIIRLDAIERPEDKDYSFSR